MNEFRSIMIWLFRALANALTGGLAFAFVGAFCGGGASGILACFGSGTFSTSVFVFGAFWGSGLGFMCGVAGIFIYFIAAIFVKQDKFWEPVLTLIKRVTLGQSLGTLCAVVAFLAFELLRSRFNSVEFSGNVYNDAIIPFVSAPIMMILGAIAAISKQN